ncbi:XdhC family protein [Streptomyces noursei]|uniref:XdhC family protein n=1 Tax=Streptomyces noursei TaxID=1971 RepID=UPI0023DBEA95|nr:XdhC family protein [Streptomyces noursei]
MTRSSTSRCWSGRSGSRSPTSARWAPAAPTSTASSGCGDVGLTELELNRLRSPIGLDLGARTPEETALSIAAEIVANRRGGTGAPLTGAQPPIHHDAPRSVGRIGEVA